MLRAVVFISGSFLEATLQGFPIQPIPFASVIAKLMLCVSHADFRQSADLIRLAGWKACLENTNKLFQCL